MDGPEILKDESERSPRISSSVDGKSGRSQYEFLPDFLFQITGPVTQEFYFETRF